MTGVALLPLRVLFVLLSLFPVLTLRAQIVNTIAGTPGFEGFSGAGGPATSYDRWGARVFYTTNSAGDGMATLADSHSLPELMCG